MLPEAVMTKSGLYGARMWDSREENEMLTWKGGDRPEVAPVLAG